VSKAHTRTRDLDCRASHAEREAHDVHPFQANNQMACQVHPVATISNTELAHYPRDGDLLGDDEVPPKTHATPARLSLPCRPGCIPNRLGRQAMVVDLAFRSHPERTGFATRSGAHAKSRDLSLSHATSAAPYSPQRGCILLATQRATHWFCRSPFGVGASAPT